MASLDLASIRTIVVTGGAGFIGSHVVDDLLDACPAAQIRVIDAFTYAANMANLDSAMRTGRVTLRQGDIGNLELVTDALRGADLVVNAAGESHVDRSFLSPERFSVSNAIGTQVLAEAMARRRVPQMIHVSTAEVYGPSSTPLAETAPMQPDNPLGASKAAAEMLLSGLRVVYDLDIRVLRPVNIVGTRQNTEKLLPRFLELAAVGKPLSVHGDGNQRRSFLAISDFCAGLRTVISRGERNGVYNISGPETYSVLEVARMVLDAVPDPVAGVAFNNGRPGNQDRPQVSTRALAALGWQAEASLRSEVKLLAGWYRSRLSPLSRTVFRNVPDLAPGKSAVTTQPAGSGLFRSLERH
ncbi:GDP-mannose 4,6-dehydratase [Rhizobium sp. ARZ01]|uniref:dTDP-glucose 4,6-dehydratase n=1 Tax=Rhizobium sp. ARZ01 TaxID=2769313 RepID=UPI0017825B1E|nr:NAD-dependent epimerase/dehydratase family protein [Rhizobium sp. ARZ01]MBD9371250.1 GDP-mannose 4,6-dehydratase [Rhizobium sp. ARZ01]